MLDFGVFHKICFAWAFGPKTRSPGMPPPGIRYEPILYRSKTALADSSDYPDSIDLGVCGNSYNFVPDSKLAEFLAQYEGIKSPRYSDE